jgi:hypothetical protein
MTDVFVERRFDQPMTDSDMQALMANAGCLVIHRVAWQASLLSSSGKEMFCHFRGPDAESVRIAMQLGGAPAGRTWACSVQDAPGATATDLAAANVLVGHRFEAPADFGDRQMSDAVHMGCFELHRVRRVRSYLSADRRQMFSLYRAPDAESVRLAQHAAGLPPDPLWAVRRFAP